MIHIFSEIEVTVGIDIRRQVGDINGHFVFEHDCLFVRPFQLIHDIVYIDIVIEERQRLQKFPWLLNTHTAMTECPDIPEEQTLGGGIMDVHRIPVGKKKLNLAQGIMPPGDLHEVIRDVLVFVLILCPVNGAGIDPGGIFVPTLMQLFALRFIVIRILY